MKKRIIVFLIAAAVLIVVALLLPFVVPLKVYNPIAGVYFEVHGTYASAVDYTKETVRIPSHSLLRPVTETGYRSGPGRGEDIVKTIELPDTVTEIGVVSYCGYDNLVKISGGNNVEVISDSAFKSAEKLIEIPEFPKLEKIEQMAFESCSLDYFKIPESLREIGDFAFSDNNIIQLEGNLNKVKTGVHTFRGNPCEQELGPFVINNRGEMQTYYGNDTTVIIPDSVNAIYGSFFDYGEDSENVEVYIPDTVTKITIYSFWFNNHGNVYIPDSVVDIAYYDDDEQFTFYNASIITTKGSYAEEFAKKYNIDYQIVDEIVIPED